MWKVTLPTERVSWNPKAIKEGYLSPVTLPTERVSWNQSKYAFLKVEVLSRSPRSVWVEILRKWRNVSVNWCHAPHGACELKSFTALRTLTVMMSRSPRSVWVEILCRNVHCIGFESRSPRSVWVEIDTIVTLYCFAPCHAPHGACELKFSFSDMQKFKIESRSPRSVWVEIYTVQYPYFVCYGHAPHGACELKSQSY